jgi:hypothetical protein
LLLLILGLRLGLKSAGKHLLSVGIVMALVAAGLTWLFDRFYSSFFPPTSNPNIGSALNQLSNLFDVAYRDNIIRLCAYMAIGGAVLLVAALVLKLVQHPAAKPVSAAPNGPLAPVSEPESLAGAPAVASFTPSGPPSLPSTPAAAPAVAAAAKPAAQKPAAKKTTAKKQAAKKPSSTSRKKK